MSIVMDRETVVAGDVVSMPAALLRRVLSGAAVCASTDATLPAISSVQLSWQDGTVTAVATDRYRLAIVSETPVVTSNIAGDLSRDDTGRILLSLDDVKRIIKLIPARVPHASLPVTLTPEGDATRFTLPFTGDSILVHALDASFPNWESLVPTEAQLDESAGVTGTAYNATFLASLAAVGKAIGLSKDAPVRVRFTEPYRPAVWDFVTGDERLTARVLLMPVRLSA